MFEQAFKNIDNILRREAGCATELDYTEQMSWLLVLKYLDDLENDKAAGALLQGRPYTFILARQYRWKEWAAPSRNGWSGHDLLAFVNHSLFPYLQRFKQKAPSPNAIEYKIGEIFGEIHNKFLSGDNLREAIYHIDMLRFGSEAEKHELLELYEAKIRNMGNARRNGGEYYTPRPLIRAMLQVVQPRLGEHIYDGACGSAGFLCESFDYLKSSQNLNTSDLKAPLTLLGKEKKSFAYVVAIMNMLLHGIETPNIIHTNPLMENLADIQEKDRFEVILSNPPFGGKERGEVQYNFPIRTSETSFLFLQHFLKMLKPGGRAGVVVPRRFLSNTNTASVSLRKLVLESCNLHTVLDCPSGTFQGCDLRTAVLFFEKGRPTRKVWFYQLDPGRNLTKAKPLHDNDLAEFVILQKTFAESPKSWSVDVADLDKSTFALAPNESRVAKGKKTINEDPLKAFICHGSEDKPAIRELYNRLRGDGVKPWLDERDILPGQDWNAEIKRAVRSSDIILVCLSSTSVGKSGYVQKEIKFALDMADEKPEGTIFIVPVKLGSCDIPERLARWQWVQYSETDGYEKIMRTLRARAEQCGLKAPGENRAMQPTRGPGRATQHMTSSFTSLDRREKATESRDSSMPKQLAGSFINLVHEAAARSFNRKKALARFLRQAGVSERFLATWTHDETKRDLLDRLFAALQSQPKGTDLVLGMARDLAQQVAFPDLRGWENSAEMTEAAKVAVGALKKALAMIDDQVVSDRERREAQERFQALQAENARSRGSLEALDARLKELATGLGSQEAGYAFQNWFYDLMDFFEVQNRRPYVTDFRQIDGSITVAGTTYLVETKFTTGQAGAPEIDIFHKKVTDKADNTMGVMISISGYSGPAITGASGRRTPLLLMDHRHLYLALGGSATFAEIVERARRHASQTGEALLAPEDF